VPNENVGKTNLTASVTAIGTFKANENAMGVGALVTGLLKNSEL
jgi:hypothetical protein